MTRQEFLRYVAGVILAVTGISALTKLLLNKRTTKTVNKFGGGAYGG